MPDKSTENVLDQAQRVRHHGDAEHLTLSLIIEHIAECIIEAQAREGESVGMQRLAVALPTHVARKTEVEIEKGIRKATQKHSKERKKPRSGITKLQEENNEMASKSSSAMQELSRMKSTYECLQKQKQKPAKELERRLRKEQKALQRRLSAAQGTHSELEQRLRAKDSEVSSLAQEVLSLQTRVAFMALRDLAM